MPQQQNPAAGYSTNLIDSIEAGILTSAAILLGRGLQGEQLSARLQALYPAATPLTIQQAIGHTWQSMVAAAHLDPATPDYMVPDHIIPINPLTPPGTYTVGLTAYGADPATGRRISQHTVIQVPDPIAYNDVWKEMENLGWRAGNFILGPYYGAVPTSPPIPAEPPPGWQSPSKSQIGQYLSVIFTKIERNP